MAKRKISNLLALAVLSLLTERPMHPYEMLSVMRLRELSTFIKLNNSSLYSVIEALQREGLIEPLETRREGRYPERTVYTTTAAGRSELIDWLRSLLRMPVTEYSSFTAALAFLGHLAPDEAATLLEEHAHHLTEQIGNIRSIHEHAEQINLDRLFMIEDQYTLILLEAKLTFIQQLIREINDGTLTEVSGDKRIWKIQHPELGVLGTDAEHEK